MQEYKNMVWRIFFIEIIITLLRITHKKTTNIMKRLSFIVLAFICSVMLTSCATIFCGSKAQVIFESDVDEPVTLTIDGRKHTNVTFPYSTKIDRGFDETIVKVEAPSYQTETIVIDKKFNPVSIINLCEVLGWGIDAATGAMMKPEYKWYQIEMTPKETPATDKE